MRRWKLTIYDRANRSSRSRSKMAKHLLVLRLAAADRQKWRRYYCDREMWDTHRLDYKQRHGLRTKVLWQFKCTAEHLIDRADGGEDDEANIVAACSFCNNRRSV